MLLGKNGSTRVMYRYQLLLKREDKQPFLTAVITIQK